MVFAKEDFSLPILHILLQVEGYGLRGAEIFGAVGNIDTKLLTQVEKMIDYMFGCKDDGGIIWDVDPVFPKLLWPNAFYVEELSIGNVKMVLLDDIGIR